MSFNAQDSFAIQSRLLDRPVPHNSITRLPAVRGYARAHGADVQEGAWPDFTRGPAPASGEPATRFSVGFNNPGGASPSAYTAEFRYNAATGLYERFLGGVLHVDAANGRPVATENVVIMVAPVIVTNIIEDILGSRSLDYQVQGEGAAYFQRDGLRWQGCWRRPGAFEPVTFWDAGGHPFPLGDGQVWIAVAGTDTPLRWQP